MVLIRKPENEDKYKVVKDFHLSLWLQRNGFHPRYMYDGVYYYYKDKEVEDAIKIYKAMQYESEVSEFGEDI